MKILLTSIIILFFLNACKEKENTDNSDSFDRSQMLTDYAENYIIPNYQEFYNSILKMEEDFTLIQTNNDITEITNFENSFKVAYTNWQKVSFLNFGPAESQSLLSLFNRYPTNTEKIKNNILAGEYDLLTASNTDAISFPALDYLIFSNDELLLPKYESDKFKKYIQDLIHLLKTRTENTLNEWNNVYKTTFAENNGKSVGSSLSLIFNSLNMYWEKDLRDGKLGIPIGIRTNAVTQKAKLEALYSKISLDLLKTSVTAYIEYFTNGEDQSRLSLYDYVYARRNTYGDGKLHQTILDNFINIQARLNNLNGNLEENIDSNIDELTSIYQDIQKQIVYLKVDMASILGVSITYQDNDGD